MITTNCPCVIKKPLISRAERKKLCFAAPEKNCCTKFGPVKENNNQMNNKNCRRALLAPLKFPILFNKKYIC